MLDGNCAVGCGHGKDLLDGKCAFSCGSGTDCGG